MSGAMPPLPQYVFMVWCLVKRRDNFTFTLNYERDSPKVNVLCALMVKSYRSFLFEEDKVTGDSFLVIMEDTALHHNFVGKILHLHRA